MGEVKEKRSARAVHGTSWECRVNKCLFFPPHPPARSLLSKHLPPPTPTVLISEKESRSVLSEVHGEGELLGQMNQVGWRSLRGDQAGGWGGRSSSRPPTFQGRLGQGEILGDPWGGALSQGSRREDPGVHPRPTDLGRLQRPTASQSRPESVHPGGGSGDSPVAPCRGGRCLPQVTEGAGGPRHTCPLLLEAPAPLLPAPQRGALCPPSL